MTTSEHADYTPPFERIRTEYIEMRSECFGFSDLYAAEFDRSLAQHDDEVRKATPASTPVEHTGTVTRRPQGEPLISLPPVYPFDRAVEDAEAVLASIPSPAQPTEANEQTLAVVAEIRNRLTAQGYHDTDRVRIALLHVEAVESGKALTLAPSPVQGADDRLAAAEAVIAEACSIIPLPYEGQENGAAIARVLLATHQQSPQAALNEVRAGALDEFIEAYRNSAALWLPEIVRLAEARAAELRAAPQTGESE